MSSVQPDVLDLRGRVVSTPQPPDVAVPGFTFGVDLLLPDGKIEPVPGPPGVTDAQGAFLLHLSGGPAAALLAGGAGLVFRSANASSRGTPLYLAARQDVEVVLHSQPETLDVRDVQRDGRLQPLPLVLAGRVVDSQGKPVGGLSVRARLETSSGAFFPSPLPGQPDPASTDAQGRFQIVAERAGDLLPYRPYAPYPWRFAASPPEGTETVAPAAVFVRPGEDTEIRLRWQASPAALAVESVLRDGRPGDPRIGRQEALGLLLDAGDGSPLDGFRVQVAATSDHIGMGVVTTQSGGFFPLPHPWFLGSDPRDLSMSWRLTVSDPEGNTVVEKFGVDRQVPSDDAVRVTVAIPRPQDLSPRLGEVWSALGITPSPAAAKFLGDHGVATLRDVLDRGGVWHLADRPAGDADNAVLTRLDEQAGLCSALPPGLESASAVQVMVPLAGRGINGVAALGSLPRSEVTQATAGVLGDFKGAQLQHVAAVRNNFLNALLLGAQVEAGYERPPERRGSSAGFFDEIPWPDAVQPPCHCDDCQTAVSPNAYLADLVRYVYARVRLGTQPMAAVDLERQLYQPFATLPAECAAMKDPVRVMRISIEALRAYKEALGDKLPPATQEERGALAGAEAVYRQAAYEALLAELGTATTELRLAQGNDQAARELGERLGIPPETVPDLLLSATELADEKRLESLFGLRDTTRDPASATPAAELAAWRLAALHDAWRQRDSPETFPAEWPIVDPDVVGLTDLRLGWNAAHPVTALWKDRRTAVDAELADLAGNRAAKVGGKAFELAVKPSPARDPTPDEAWAAFLAVTVTDAETQSMAATLPADQQDEARHEAARKKARDARRQRTNDPKVELTPAEDAVVTAVVNAPGVPLLQEVQKAAKEHADGRITGLQSRDDPPTTLPTLPIGAWAGLYAVLKGSDRQKADDAVAVLARFDLSLEAFLRLWDLKLKLEAQGLRAIDPAEWGEADEILVGRWKRGKETEWLREEQTARIALGPDLFWLAPETPRERRWLSPSERRARWIAVLRAASEAPLLDPDLLTPADFASTATTDKAFALFLARRQEIESTFQQIAAARREVEGRTSDKKAAFDEKLLAPYLALPATPSGASPAPWYEPGSLQEAFTQGSLPLARLDQLLLGRGAFNQLFRVRSLLAAGEPVAAEEWQDVEAILLQTSKRRLSGLWHAAESAAQLALSPEFFKLPEPPPLTFPPAPPPVPAFPAFRAAPADLAAWRDRLATRIQEEKDLLTQLADLVDRSEAAALPQLRDALVAAHSPMPAGTPLATKATWLTDRLLLDYQIDAGARTTRVAQAMTTLQLLLFALRDGSLFTWLREHLPADAGDLFPSLALNADHFDTEWQWMGSYANWRSALFLFLYPENLLYPTLRRREEQSQPFRDLVEGLRSGGQVTVPDVRNAVEAYRHYFDDVHTLNEVTTCTALIPADLSETSIDPHDAQRREVLFCFAIGSSGAAYWCTRELADATGEGSLWSPIPGWSNAFRLIGATPAGLPAGKRYVVVFGLISDKGKTKLQFSRLDLDRLGTGATAWAGPTELDGPADNLGVPFLAQAIAEDFHQNGGWLVPTIFFDLNFNVYRRRLNDELTGWSPDEAWRVYSPLPSGCIDLKAVVITWGSAFIEHLVSSCFAMEDGTPFAGALYWTVFGRRRYLNPGLFGNFESALLLGQDHVLFCFSNMGFTIGPRNDFGFTAFDRLLPGLSTCSLARLTYGQPRPIVIREAPVFKPQRHRAGTLKLSATNSAETAFPDTGVLVPWSQTTVAITDLRPGVPGTGRREGLRLAYQSDSYKSAALRRLLEEAFFSVPIHLALQLQQAGFYQAAHDWYRSVYDWNAPPDDRKIFYGLVVEEGGPAWAPRSQDWLRDPMNPHGVAALRPLAYTRFTLLSILRCLLDFADAQFAEDTAESLPKARGLYEAALRLLDFPELRFRKEDGCDILVGELPFPLIPAEWVEVAASLRSALAGAFASLPRADRQSLSGRVVGALQAPGKEWGDRFQEARRLLTEARAHLPAAPGAGQIMAADQAARTQAQLGLLADPTRQALSMQLGRSAGRRFRAAVAKLTGVPEQDLDAGGTNLRFAWLARPQGPVRLELDPARRVPVLVEPAGAVSEAFRQRAFWNPLAPEREAIDAHLAAANPVAIIAAASAAPAIFIAAPPLSFCIPPNPVLRALWLRTEVNLYKLRTGRNIAGLERSVDFYAAPTDAQTGLPALGAGGALALPGRTRLAPTPFRYPTLVERARRLVSLAAQFESAMLQSLEKRDAENRSLLEARGQLQVQRATLGLKRLEIQEAELGVEAAQVQQQRTTEVKGYFDGLLGQGLLAYERDALLLMMDSNLFSWLSAALFTGSVFFNAGGLGSAASSVAQALSTTSQVFSMLASFERRRQDWQHQSKLADFDLRLSGIQLQQAGLRVSIKEREEQIVNLQVDHAEAVVDFLVNKFTNAELFEWMSRVMQGLYAGLLQQAASTARLAQQQLAFDRLEDLALIQSDYWTVPVEGPPSAPGSSGPDRRGLTGSARLQKDLEELDAFALASERRRLQLTRTLSLASVLPGEFQRFRQSGELWFETSERDFDREFPGHYFRRLRRVRLSVVALVPPAAGIRATLANIGPSRVIAPGVAGFEERVLPPSYDAVAFTSPQNATGLFELDAQPDLRFPFEGVGVSTLWHLELPRPANPFDFASLADVLVTFEYTALDSPDRRAELMADPAKLPTKIQAVRAFSFRRELADAWYELHNPGSAPAALRVRFEVRREDFPSHLQNVRATRLSFYMPVSPDARGERVDLSAEEASKKIGLAWGDGQPAVQALDHDHLIVSASSSGAWMRQLPNDGSPYGRVTLELPATQTILDLFREDRIDDILFAINYEAALPAWPTGRRPQRALF